MPALVLPITGELVAATLPDARYVAQQYQNRPSVYETTQERIQRGLLAQKALAWHLGRDEADPREPWRYPYDIAPDIEVRAVGAPRQLERWSNVCLTLYAKDRGKTKRRWVLAVVGDDIRYLGWQTGRALLAHGARVVSQGGRAYTIAGELYPDELRPMAELCESAGTAPASGGEDAPE